MQTPSYEATVEALSRVPMVGPIPPRVRLTAANGYSITGVYSTKDYGHTVDHLINNRGGSSILHSAVRVEYMGANGRYVEVSE